MAENGPAANTSSTFPMMPTPDTAELQRNSNYSDNHDEIAEKHSRSTEKTPDNNNTTANLPEEGNEAKETTGRQFTSPLPSTPVGCSTEQTAHKRVDDNSAAPPGPIKRKSTIKSEIDSHRRKTFVRLEEPIVRRSDGIRTAKRAAKLGGMEYFYSKLDRLEKKPTTPSKAVRIMRQRTLAAKNVQSTSAMYLGSQDWFR